MVLGHTDRSNRLGLQLPIIRNLHHGAGRNMLANHQWLQSSIFGDDESLAVGCSYYKDKEAYLQGQLGNPEGVDSPNKKYYDPRVWLRKGQESMIARLALAFKELNAIDVL